MTLTKKTRPALVGTLTLTAILSLAGSGRWLLPEALGEPASHQVRKSKAGPGTIKPEGAESSSEADIPPEIGALWRSPSDAFVTAFARVGEEPREQSIDNLRKFIGSGPGTVFGINLGGGGTAAEKQAACYALARLLAKGKNNQPTFEERKEALSLYEKSLAMNCLHMPSVWHMIEIFNALGDESTLRSFLGKIGEDALADSNDKARALYELGQSYVRTGQAQIAAAAAAPPAAGGTTSSTTQPPGQVTAPSPDGDQAKSIFLALREKYPGSEYAKGAAYYLAQLALAQAGGAPTPQAVSYLREYLKSGTGGRFAGDVADKLVSLSQGQTVSTIQAGTAGAASTAGGPSTAGSPSTAGGPGKAGGPGIAGSPGTAGCQSSAPPAVTLTAADLEQIGAIYFKRGDLTKALGIYDRLGPNAKLLQRAQCYAKLGRNNEAVAAILAAVKQDPASSTYDDYASTVCVPLTKDDATDLWRKILALNPKHADHALYNIATRVEEKEALPLLSKLLNQFPTSEHAPESLWWVFWYQTKVIYPASVVKEKEKTLALINLADQGTARYPQHRVAARLAFWAGKLYEKLGLIDEAKKEYDLAADKWPTNYYAARARHRLHFLAAAPDKRHDRGFSIANNRMLSPDSWQWPQPPNLFSFDKVAPLVGSQALVLAVTHQAEECLSKLDAAPAGKETTAAAHTAIDCLRAWLYLTEGLPIEGIRAAGKDLDGQPSKSPRWQIVYPWAFASTINETAKKNSVDPYLVHALIREESRYYPRALSRSKAIGLMQLMPGTAFGVAKRIGLPLKSTDEVYIPDNNIKMGTAYLAYTLNRFDGMAMLAVASYNGGPNAVKGWVDQFHAKGLSDWDIFVENIPFRETRDYVRKVFGSYWTYELIYQ